MEPDLGEDHAIWGGEFLVGDYSTFTRAFHLEYLPLPGGDSAIHTPAKIALAYLHHYHLEWDEALAPVRYFSHTQQELLRKQLDANLNVSQTSSMGRLFDAVSALIGVKQVVSYEGQAAIEFEACRTLINRPHLSI